MKKNLCLLITNTRSRSTFLLDTIRTIFNIEIDGEYDNFKTLYLKGSRYPLDLCDLTGSFSHIKIEVLNNKHSSIPVYEKNKKPEYSIEKIHPHFIKLPYRIFKFLLLYKYKKIKVIYLVRDPKEALKSFIRYGEVNPNWIKGKTTPDFITKQYKELYKLNKKISGLIIENKELDNYKELLSKISNYLELEPIEQNLKDYDSYNKKLYRFRKEHSLFVNDHRDLDLTLYKKSLYKAYFFYKQLLKNK